MKPLIPSCLRFQEHGEASGNSSTHLSAGVEGDGGDGGGGHSVNIKASAVVKCWVVCENSTSQASNMVPELCWNARCPGRGGRTWALP